MQKILCLYLLAILAVFANRYIDYSNEWIIIPLGNFNIFLPKGMKMVALNIPTGKTSYSRKELFDYFRREKPELTQNSFKWLISDYVKNNYLYKISSDTYSTVPSNKAVYKPVYSDETSKLIFDLAEFYPDVKFVVFESFLLNEFVNHQISQNTIVVMVEKEFHEFVFDHLNSEYPGRVLLSPDAENLNRYWTSDCIIVERMVSEAPLNTEDSHKISIEKFLVDIVADKILPELFTHSEYELIFEEAFERYNIDVKKLKRYANRRSSWNEISKYIKEN